MKHFFIPLPGLTYAVDEYADSKAKALKQFKERNKMSRMPRGYSIWEA